MNRNQIIETMARAAFESNPAYKDTHPEHRYIWADARHGADGAKHFREATAALSALEAAGLVVVPVEPTEAMIEAGYCRPYQEDNGRDELADANTELTYTAMIKAAQEGKP